MVPTPSALSPLVSASSSIFVPVISPSARNMPSDSIMTTIMTMHIVTIGTMENFGMPKWSGLTTSIQDADATFSKCITPRRVARIAPATMPSRTETLELAISGIWEGARYAIHHAGQSRQAAARPIDADSHQRDADDQDDGSGHDW